MCVGRFLGRSSEERGVFVILLLYAIYIANLNVMKLFLKKKIYEKDKPRHLVVRMRMRFRHLPEGLNV